MRTGHSCYHLMAMTLNTKDPASSYEMILHSVYCTSAFSFVLLEFASFIKAPEVVIGVFNMLSKSNKLKVEHTETASFRSYSMQEIVAIMLPVLTCQFNFTTHSLIAIFCTKIHLYQFLDDVLKNPLVFTVLFTQEFLIFQGHLAAFIITSVNFLMFFESINNALNSEIHLLRSNMKQSAINLQQKFIMCRETQLLINLFNQGYSSIIYLFKMFFLFLAIGCTYFGIRCASTHLIMSIFLNSIGDGLASKYFQKRVASIRSVGIQVGGFHTMERESTPTFVDFAVRFVSSLLITSH
ncbi:unnamed protein product [Allacma fusca]|uniref:Uncharacterized protein n=1 Tax=Allacma fusca TaxID=39272 RepID=A0A8J2L0W4_9HEXA|nr:unnamed protein product [Allacma fusca]